MKIRISQKLLLQMLGTAQGVTEVIDVKPILSQVYLRAGENNLEVYASGLDTALKISRQAQEEMLEVKKDGGVVLPAKRLHDLVKELPEGMIEVKAKENHWAEITYLSTGSKKQNLIQLMGLNPEEYPKLPAFESESMGFAVPAKVFNQMIERTIIATSKDERRPYLQGVFLCCPGGEKGKKEAGEKIGKGMVIRMVSTDGHRLALMNVAVEGREVPDALKKGVILPRKGIQEVRRIIGNIESVKSGEGEAVQVSVSRNLSRIQAGENAIFIRYIEGEFPDYNAVIPKEERNTLKVSRGEILKALRRASALASRDVQGIKIRAEKGNLVLHTHHPDTGEIREEIDASYEGKAVEMVFNARYLSEGIESFSDEEVNLDFGDEVSPLMVYGREGRDHLILVMPLRND